MNETIARLLAEREDADETLTRLMPAIGLALECDRCVLFPRNPATGKWSMSHAWQARPEYALERVLRSWSLPAPDEGETDPMYAQAMQSSEVLFIDDVLEAPPTLVNAELELHTYGNRSLAHVPVYHEGRYLGLLEPCTIGRPHDWTPTRRQLVTWVQAELGPLVWAYVASAGE